MPDGNAPYLTAKQRRMMAEYREKQKRAENCSPDTVEKLYRAFTSSGDTLKTAELMLVLRGLLSEIADFDPATGKALPADISGILETILCIDERDLTEKKKDRVYRLTEHTEGSIRHITEHIRGKISREHAMIPVYAVREMDGASIQWLARKAGRTLREKLSGKPYLKAVRRRESYDTAENRLFKAFLQKFDEILIWREDYLKDSPPIHPLMQRWLRADDAEDIGSWANLSPNNTLLQDKHYRKIWDGWKTLRQLDNVIAGDYGRRQQDFITVVFWKILAQMSLSSRFRLLQSPVLIDYDSYGFSVPGAQNNDLFAVKGFLIAPGVKYTGEFTVSLKTEKNSASIEILFDSSAITVLCGQQGIDVSEKTGNYQRSFGDSFPEAQSIAREIVALLLGASAGKYAKNPEPDNPAAETAVIDLYNVRPRFIVDNNIKRKLPFALLLQFWNNNTVDCGKSSAIQFAPGIKTISIRNLFYNDDAFTSSEKNSAAMELIGRIRKYLNVNNLVYLVPDWASDFDLESLRRAVNFHYDASSSLPQSISAVSAWFKKYKKTGRNINTIFLVVDFVDDTVSVTPIQGCAVPELEKSVPETLGICWERHPNIMIDCESSEKTDNIAPEMYRAFGADFIADSSNTLSIYDEKRLWHHLPQKADRFLKMRPQKIISREKITAELYRSNALFSLEQPLVFIVLDDSIEISGPKPEMSTAENLLDGAGLLAERQERAGELPLWKDHLPELSLKTPAGICELVGKNTPPIVPYRGKMVMIPVSNSFSLPKMTRDYLHFDLIQGQGSLTSKYVAFLRSPAFPLKQEIPCELYLTYTYGEARPYNLQFKPKDRVAAGFTSVEVEWRTKDELPKAEPIAPPFPKPKTWEDFKTFPNKEGGGTSDLLDWCMGGLEWLDINQRKTGIIKTKFDKGGSPYCFVTVNGQDIFCHSNDFLEPYEPSVLSLGSEVYLDTGKNKMGRIKGINITYSQSTPEVLYMKYSEFLKSKRFPMLTIWNNGHSLSEPDAPSDLREKTRAASVNALALLQDDNIIPKLRDELFFFLSYLHRDMPPEAARYLIQNLETDCHKYQNAIAYSIGGGSLEWQNTLFENTLKNKQDNTNLFILAIALWRNKELIDKITDEMTQELLAQLKKAIKDTIDLIINKQKGYISLIRYLELLLALLRKTPLHSGDRLTEWFVEQLDKIQELLMAGNIELRSYVDIDLKELKPKNLENVPDLLYALRLYLTGDDGANTIIINDAGVAGEGMV